MPDTVIAEPDSGDSQSGGTTSDVDEESDSDIDSRSCKAAKVKRIARQLRHRADYNTGPNRRTQLRFIRLISTMHICYRPRSGKHPNKEFANMSKHDVYESVPALKGCKIIGSVWVFEVKFDDLYKSRFCLQGYAQVAAQTLVTHFTLQSVGSQVSALCWPFLPATAGLRFSSMYSQHFSGVISRKMCK